MWKALPVFSRALAAFRDNDFEQALILAQQAHEQQPELLVFAEAVTYLTRLNESGKQDVYLNDEGFRAFIRGGGNVPLYRAVSAALQEVYRSYDTLNLLDVGTGDGRALLPALTDNIRHLTVLEPSESLLRQLRRQLDEHGVSHEAHCAPFQYFTQMQAGSWDVIEATFSLQSIPPQERASALTWGRQHGKRVLLVEFDAPDLTNIMAIETIRYIVERYEQGVAEYAEDRALVAQGFLMPMMFGYFDCSQHRTNYEQPVAQWIQEFQAAGFTTVDAALIYPYWWAAAYIIDAS
ncbi:hypothetical protein U14_03843 [Candidatus Moduliflexus flocculans]|uniref:Methyltransferase domain-containing protein n=1 Tax=Candidatus Moduliflexus flocculans TaxID=1499966 RepID=A0A081BQC5_9BACT|nr:hypothetical protein U14_03843 [Candidatus Moduliflexus flocculans]